MEDYAASREHALPTKGIVAARERWRGQDRLAKRLAAQVPAEVIVRAGLALIAARDAGAEIEPNRINAGLSILGTDQATAYLAGQSDLFYQILKSYQTVLKSQQPQPPANVPLKFLPALDPALDNELRIAVNLRLLRDAVKGDKQKTQAVERVIRG